MNQWPIYWNLVHADGSYYYTNVFRDDPEIQDDPSFAFHTYFNLDYEEISESHTPTDGTLIPLSDNEFNYYKEAGLTADSGEKLTALFEKLIEDAVSRETTVRRIIYGIFSAVQTRYTIQCSQLSAQLIAGWRNPVRKAAKNYRGC